MKKTLLITVWLLIGSHISYAGTKENPSARGLILKSVAAMGGEKKLMELKTLSLEAIGHTYLLEQSERPEGPWIVNYNQILQVRDYHQQRLFLKKEDRNVQQQEWAGSTMLYEGGAVALKTSSGQIVPGRASQLEEVMNVLHFAPEQLLKGALNSNDLKILKDTVLQGIPHHGITFTYKDIYVKLFLNAHTSLPTLLQTTRAYPQDLMWAVWGDVRTDVFFSFWSLTPQGIYYPLQYNLYRNNQPYQEMTILSLKLNEEVSDETFAIPEKIKTAFAAQPNRSLNDIPLGRPDQPPYELAPDVLLIPGFWNISLIRQEDGVILLEAPISGGYTAQAIAKAKSLYPGLKIKGVISTSDAWPHVAGIRECAFQNLPIYTLELNKSLLQRIISAPLPSGNTPSGKTKNRTKFKTVSAKMDIGAGANRMELYPVLGESGERMMLVYFPEHKLLYASDLVQPSNEGSFFQKAYIAEVVSAVKRNGLVVEQVFAMHSGALPFSRLQEALEAKIP